MFGLVVYVVLDFTGFLLGFYWVLPSFSKP